MCSSWPASRLRASQPSSFLFAIRRFLQRVSRRRRTRGSCTERNKKSKYNEWIEASEGPTCVNERKGEKKSIRQKPKRKERDHGDRNRSPSNDERGTLEQGVVQNVAGWVGVGVAESILRLSPTGRRRARAARQAQSCHSALSGEKQTKTRISVSLSRIKKEQASVWKETHLARSDLEVPRQHIVAHRQQVRGVLMLPTPPEPVEVGVCIVARELDVSRGEKRGLEKGVD